MNMASHNGHGKSLRLLYTEFLYLLFKKGRNVTLAAVTSYTPQMYENHIRKLSTRLPVPGFFKEEGLATCWKKRLGGDAFIPIRHSTLLAFTYWVEKSKN